MFLGVKTVSDKVVMHSLSYLSVLKSLVGDVPLVRENLADTDPPLAKCQFSVYFCS